MTMKPWPFLLFCVILCSCNMGQHYAHLRIGHNAESINTETQAPTKTFASIPAPGVIEPKYNDSLEEAPLAMSNPTKQVCPALHPRPDTLLSSPTRNKPKGYQASYSREVPHKRHGTTAYVVLLCLSLAICLGLTIALLLAVDGSIYSLILLMGAGVFGLASLVLLILLIITLNRDR